MLLGTRLKGEMTNGLKLTFSMCPASSRSPKSLRTTQQFFFTFLEFRFGLCPQETKVNPIEREFQT